MKRLSHNSPDVDEAASLAIANGLRALAARSSLVAPAARSSLVALAALS